MPEELTPHQMDVDQLQTEAGRKPGGWDTFILLPLLLYVCYFCTVCPRKVTSHAVTCRVTSGHIGKQCRPLTAHLALLHISTRWQCHTHSFIW